MDPLVLPSLIGAAIVMVVLELARRWVNSRREVHHAPLPDGDTSPPPLEQSAPDGGRRP